jgi:hypothetical protein
MQRQQIVSKAGKEVLCGVPNQIPNQKQERQRVKKVKWRIHSYKTTFNVPAQLQSVASGSAIVGILVPNACNENT